MPISFGDIAVDATANVNVENATFNFGSLIELNTNPYTFAASVVIQVLVSIWNAAKERELLEQQIALLKEMNQKLDALNMKADAILKRLNELPAILLPAIRNIVRDEVKMGRLDGYYVQLDSVELQFQTILNYKVHPDQWNDLKTCFYGICQDEFRYQKLLFLVKYTELMNFICAGKERKYFAESISKAAANVESFQRALGESIVNRYRDAVQLVADGVNNFYPLRCESPYYPGWVYGFSAHAPHLQIAQTTRALNDILINDSITPNEQLRAICRGASIVFDSSPLAREQLSIWMQGGAQLMNSPNMSDVVRGTHMLQVEDIILSNYTSRFANALGGLKGFHEQVFPQIQEDITRFRDLQELKAALRQGAEIDYGKKLRKSPSRIG